jgi:hypothetical protein
MPREKDDACSNLVARVERSETRENSRESTGRSRISLRSIRATRSFHMREIGKARERLPREKDDACSDFVARISLRSIRATRSFHMREIGKARERFASRECFRLLCSLPVILRCPPTGGPRRTTATDWAAHPSRLASRAPQDDGERLERAVACSKPRRGSRRRRWAAGSVRRRRHIR